LDVVVLVGPGEDLGGQLSVLPSHPLSRRSHLQQLPFQFPDLSISLMAVLLEVFLPPKSSVQSDLELRDFGQLLMLRL
jgi:hypothetical protein